MHLGPTRFERQIATVSLLLCRSHGGMGGTSQVSKVAHYPRTISGILSSQCPRKSSQSQAERPETLSFVCAFLEQTFREVSSSLSCHVHLQRTNARIHLQCASPALELTALDPNPTAWLQSDSCCTPTLSISALQHCRVSPHLRHLRIPHTFTPSVSTFLRTTPPHLSRHTSHSSSLANPLHPVISAFDPRSW